MKTEKFLDILKNGFYPWQTMPFHSANIFGTPQKGIFLILTNDYPSFGEGDGNKVMHCPPEDFGHVMPVIKKVFETENADHFAEVEEYFSEVDDIEKSFILPDGQAIGRGDYIQITWQPHYTSQPMTRIMIVGLITSEDIFSDADQHDVCRKDIKSIRKITGLIMLRERPEGDNDRLLHNQDCETAQIFGRSIRPDTIRSYDILIGDEPTGFVQFDSVKDEYRESHIVEEKYVSAKTRRTC